MHALVQESSKPSRPQYVLTNHARLEPTNDLGNKYFTIRSNPTSLRDASAIRSKSGVPYLKSLKLSKQSRVTSEYLKTRKMSRS